MAVFISHSFENKPEFENITDALGGAGVPYWNPADVKPRSSLRGQLLQAVEHCNACIFIATHRAVASSWCGAELGAFWGAGKPIIVYLADSSLKDEDLPPIVQGDVWERKISRIVARASELAQEPAAAANSTKSRSSHIGNMTWEQLESLIVGAVSLAAATAKSEGGSATFEGMSRAVQGAANSVVGGAKTAQHTVDAPTDEWRNQVLWVDDRPANNTYERQAFESTGIDFTLALSTSDALEIMSTKRFGAIISDMGRVEGPREGYVLLEAIRVRGDKTPFFIYAGSNAPRHKREAKERGAQGTTNNAQELYAMIISALG